MTKEKPYYSIISFLLVAFISIVSTRLWSYTSLGNAFGLVETCIFLILTTIVVYNYEAFPLKKAQFSIQVTLFIFLPLVSAVAAYFFHHQSALFSFLALKNNFLWLLYFVLHLLKVPVKKLITLMLFIGGIWILLTVVQQFTYPNYWFSTRSEETSYDFYRAGVYRFMLDDHHYGLFILFYFFYRLLMTRKIIYSFPVLISLVGFYYYGTRQFALAGIACIVFAAVTQKGKARIEAILVISITALVLVGLKEILFSGYIELTNEQLGTQEEDIRVLSGNFYLFEYWPHWITPVIGNGLDHIESDYGLEMYSYNKDLGFYRSDVGIVGAFNTFGIFYILNIIYLNIKGLNRKYYTEDNKHLRLFFINALLLLVISEYYSYESAIPFFCMILYMVDQSYKEKKEERRLNESYKIEELQVAEY